MTVTCQLQKLILHYSVVNKKENCAQLHTPANGYMTCDSLAFGYFCAPSCDEDHVRQADDVNQRLAHDYFCDKGKWKPDNVVGDCRSKIVFSLTNSQSFLLGWACGNHPTPTQQKEL